MYLKSQRDLHVDCLCRGTCLKRLWKVVASKHSPFSFSRLAKGRWACDDDWFD